MAEEPHETNHNTLKTFEFFFFKFRFGFSFSFVSFFVLMVLSLPGSPGGRMWRQVHPGVLRQFIAGPYASICGFNTLPKGTSAVL